MNQRKRKRDGSRGNSSVKANESAVMGGRKKDKRGITHYERKIHHKESFKRSLTEGEKTGWEGTWGSLTIGRKKE